jgi:chorismate mutase
MSTYTKNGARQVKLQQKVKIKKQVKEFYTRVEQINEISKYLVTLEDKVTEDNIDAIVSELIGRELDSLEKTMILSKLNSLNET